MRNATKKIFNIAVYFFAATGFVFVTMFFAVKYGLTNEKGIIDSQRAGFFSGTQTRPENVEVGIVDWMKTEEWAVFKEAVVKDKDVINRASSLTDVPARLIVAELAAEQMRFMTSDRELFKTVFYPLKILGSLSQFSWGVNGIKEQTAIIAESSLKDHNSPFYPGEKYENLLDFKTEDQNKERYERLTDEHDRYYSYLYTAIINKEISKQWQKAGYNISNRPEILGTLFNIGFQNSNPNSVPQTGGALIKIDGREYSFGGIVGDFYYSDELIDSFPR